VRNPTLMAALRRRLAPASLVTSDELGLPSSAKEAYLTALLGFLTWSGVPATNRVLGNVTPGDSPLCLPAPATTEVTRLRVTADDEGGSRASA
jgi:anhydro-N-acetylmuramic acid kinase